MATEMSIVDKIITEALQEGYSISVVAFFGEIELKKSTNFDEIKRAMVLCGALYLYHRETGNEYRLIAADLLGRTNFNIKTLLTRSRLYRQYNRQIKSEVRGQLEPMLPFEIKESIIKILAEYQAAHKRKHASSRRGIEVLKKLDHGFKFADFEKYHHFYNAALARLEGASADGITRQLAKMIGAGISVGAGGDVRISNIHGRDPCNKLYAYDRRGNSFDIEVRRR